ncbi:hypothetical protein DENSPDRAFT_925849 [Dentipellis sp. KUC8613]|nr:hypothetical protein DENSPDRAFT_925849 [Dentipellis sp. KUC8613]
MPFFLSSDITTFLIQAAGGGISLGNGPNSAQNGGHIFLAGLVLQLVSFLIYTAIFTTFTYRVRKYEPTVWAKDAGMRWYNDWRALAGALGLSCVGIIIRSCYRVAEMSEGFLGSLSTTEGYFYGLDTLPLFIAIVVYIPFWPGRFIRASSQSGVADEEKTNHDGNANGDASDRVGSEEFAAVTEVT